MGPSLRFASCFAGLALLFGCDNTEAPASEDDPCAQAQRHLEDCFGTEVMPLVDCTPEIGEKVLQRTCGTLMEPGKEDGLGDLLCDLGLLSHCALPLCDIEPQLEDANVCADYIGQEGCASCGYYACRDEAREVPCGPDGFPLGYGERYCNRFSLITFEHVSPAGQLWLTEVRECLQVEFDALSDELTCEDLAEAAYDTHPECYVQTGFCDLPWTDVLQVGATIDLSDLKLRTILETGVGCFAGILAP